jgi:two-component system cell cycle response regulator DivK
MTKVLVAEDNPINRELLRELLENRGYAVVEACDGQEALRMVDETQPDILLLDISMPVLDGYAVARKIRENPGLTLLPILAITAYAMQGDREKILDILVLMDTSRSRSMRTPSPTNSIACCIYERIEIPLRINRPRAR